MGNQLSHTSIADIFKNLWIYITYIYISWWGGGDERIIYMYHKSITGVGGIGVG